MTSVDGMWIHAQATAPLKGVALVVPYITPEVHAFKQGPCLQKP